MESIKNISLYIPHVYANYTSAMIMDVFDEMRIGRVKSVDLVPKVGSDGKAYNAAYIHFYEWYDTIYSQSFQGRVLDPKLEARVMYDDPWYWIVLENKSKKHVPGDRKPKIDLDAFSGTLIKPKPTAGFDCGHTPAQKEAKPTNYISPKEFKKAALDVINGISWGVNAPKKAKSWAQVAQPPTPVKLESAFNSEYVNEDITQEEMDWALEEMENAQMMAEMEAEMEKEDEYLISIDSRYVQSVEEENEMLRSQLAYFQNLYYTESIKSQTLADTIKNMKV